MDAIWAVPESFENWELLNRVDTLLAVASTYAPATDAVAAAPGDLTISDEALSTLFEMPGLSVTEQQALENRTAWLADLSPAGQFRWIAGTMKRMRIDAQEQVALLDEQIHPSHFIAALRAEPANVQSVVLSRLPRTVADYVNAGLTPFSQSGLSEQKEPMPLALDVVRRTFFARFISRRELGRPTHLDLLSGTELARLVRLLGARETARAVRGIEQPELRSFFLSRFSAEDALPLIEYLAALPPIGHPSVALATDRVSRILQGGFRDGALLDRLGLEVLALVLTGIAPERVQYLQQKLPWEVAQKLQQLMTAAPTETELPSMIIEVEELCCQLRLRAGRTEST